MCQKCHGATMNLTQQMIVHQDGQTVTPKAKSDLLPLFVNKTLLDHCYTHLFKYCLWCFVLQWPIEYLPQRLHSQKSLKYLPSGPQQKTVCHFLTQTIKIIQGIKKQYRGAKGHAVLKRNAKGRDCLRITLIHWFTSKTVAATAAEASDRVSRTTARNKQ